MAVTEATNSDGTPEERLERLRDLSPSAKLVYHVLDREGELSQGELADETLLPPRTTRYALGKLTDENLVTERQSLRDPRKKLYESRSVAQVGE